MTDAEWIAFFSKPEIAAFNRTMAEYADAPLPRLVFADWVEENCPEPRFVAAMRKSIEEPLETIKCRGLPNSRGAALRLRFGRLWGHLSVNHFHPVQQQPKIELLEAVWGSGWLGYLSFVTGPSHELSRWHSHPLFELLQELDFGRTPLPMARPLFASLRAPQLRRLDLSDCRIGDVGALALSRCDSLGELRELNLSNNALSAGGAGAIIGSKALPNLMHLDLSRNPIGDEGLQHFLHARPHQRLKSLLLFGNDTGSVGAGYLASAPCLTEVEELVLSPDEIGPVGAATLANSRYLPEHIRAQWRAVAEGTA